jgi:signal transduction histidine kinase
MTPKTLQNRLIVWVLGVTGVIYLLSALLLYETLQISAADQVRKMLRHQLELVTGLLEEEDEGRVIELELEALKSGDFVDLFSGRYYIVLVPNQAPILSASLGGKLPLFMSEVRSGAVPQFQFLKGPQQENLMVLSQTIYFAHREIQVVVAESLAETQAWLAQIRTALCLGIPMVLLLLLGLIWGVVRWGLLPLQGLIADIHGFELQKSTSLPVRPGRPVKELQQLGLAFDALIKRIVRVRQAEEQLLQDISHQLKTPVTVILSTCDVILQRERSAPTYQQALEQIRSTGRDMGTLLKRLLSAAHLASGAQQDLHLVPVVLEEIAQQAIQMLQPFAQQKGLILRLETKAGQQVRGDETRLRELLVILLENAIHYSPPETEIVLSTQAEGQWYIVSVQDQGPGISDEELPHIFSRFYRGASAQCQPGTGLGLTIALQIAHLHQGELSVSNIPGQGACFRLCLPRIAPLVEDPD